MTTLPLCEYDWNTIDAEPNAGDEKFFPSNDDEPILSKDKAVKRLIIFPIEHHDIWELYKKTLAQTWFPGEIDFSKDRKDWEKMTEGERKYIKLNLAFFAGADAIVMENVANNLQSQVQASESFHYYSHQNFMESMHAQSYSLMIESLIPDREEQEELHNFITKDGGSVKMLASWFAYWSDPNKHCFVVRLLAQLFFEGVVFYDKFASVFGFKKRNKLNGICSGNLLIARDEGSHEEHSIMLYHKLIHKVPVSIVRQMIKQMVRVESHFLDESMPEPVLGMNKEMMLDYVKLVTDRTLMRLGFESYFNVKPNGVADMMDTIGMENKVSQFEHRNHVYQKSNIMASQTLGSKSHDFCTDGDF